MQVARLLRSNKVGRAHDHIGTGDNRSNFLGIVLTTLQPRQPEIEDFHRTAPAPRLAARQQDQQIGRLDIAMHHAHLMCVLQAFCGLADEFAGKADRQGALLAHQPIKVGTVDVLEH